MNWGDSGNFTVIPELRTEWSGYGPIEVGKSPFEMANI